MPESKVSIIKVIRAILRENVRRNMKGEGMLERSCKEHLAPLRSTLPSSARLGGFLKRSYGDLSSSLGCMKHSTLIFSTRYFFLGRFPVKTSLCNNSCRLEFEVIWPPNARLALLRRRSSFLGHEMLMLQVFSSDNSGISISTFVSRFLQSFLVVQAAACRALHPGRGSEARARL